MASCSWFKFFSITCSKHFQSSFLYHFLWQVVKFFVPNIKYLLLNINDNHRCPMICDLASSAYYMPCHHADFIFLSSTENSTVICATILWCDFYMHLWLWNKSESRICGEISWICCYLNYSRACYSIERNDRPCIIVTGRSWQCIGKCTNIYTTRRYIQEMIFFD